MINTCSICNVAKPYTEFYKAAKAKNGCSNRCKACDLAYQRSRQADKAVANTRWYEKNRDTYLSGKREATKAKRVSAAEYRVQATGILDGTQEARWRKNRAARMMSKIQATPAWSNAEHKTRINAIYALTQQLQEVTGAIYHVDHIVPLHSNLVCGLHVWWNLQPLPEKTNILKNDAFDPAIFPEQGEVAFPFGGGRPVVRTTLLVKVEESDE
tara:strand:+ start:195 stop:833 length:639 start_codon:yes stop_codon:yes gene_type:complete